MAHSMSSLRVVRTLSTLVVPAIAFAAVTLAPRAAQAQYVIVQAPPPPPPPPPPRAYVYPYGYPYGYPPPPPRPAYYYVDREPLYALALGADLEGAVPVGVNVPTGDGAIKGGGGFKVRLGEQFRLIGARFTPEVGFGYDHLWANDAYGNTYGWDMNRLFVGARLSFGRILVPVIYAHVGYGWRQTETNDLPNSVPDQGGLAYDFGGALDLRVVPHFGFGVHLEYAAIDIPTQPQWIAAGLHADIIF